MQAHNAEKSFKCVICGRASTDNRFLKHHMPTHFLDEMECVICSMKLVLRLMKSHMQYNITMVKESPFVNTVVRDFLENVN